MECAHVVRWHGCQNPGTKLREEIQQIRDRKDSEINKLNGVVEELEAKEKENRIHVSMHTRHRCLCLLRGHTIALRLHPCPFT